MYIYHALVDALSIHSCRVNLAPASMKGSSPEGNDSEPWDKAGSPNVRFVCAFWPANNNRSFSLKFYQHVNIRNLTRLKITFVTAWWSVSRSRTQH